MKFNLLICTYKRAEALRTLLDSVAAQILYPDEILVIDGSPNEETREMLEDNHYLGLLYFKVTAKDRGLTRQRNYGIAKTGKDIEVICFLDDDTILEPQYFEQLIGTYQKYPDAMGVGGYIINEVKWKKSDQAPDFDEFELDGFIRKLGSRNLLRKKLSLLSDKPPGFMPEFSNGLSTSFLPPSGKTYAVEFFMGGVASFRKNLFDQLSFSEYFEGYGLYEDMDFCLRASRLGQLYVNTGARLSHHHEESGRPNPFSYGKMVIRNGWYVWRVKYPRTNLKSRLKWHSTALLLILVRLGNVINTKNKKEAFTESLGRLIGWGSLLIKKPK